METKDQYLTRILERIKEERGLDFSQYRENLLSRRVMARVRLTRRDNFEQYLAFLKFHPDEMDLLMDTLTINVTEFFRDTKVFDVIEKKVIPEIFRKKEEAGLKSVNIWSCGCSSGEEPYSILMLISEYLGKKFSEYKITINATDIDSQSLAKAKEGVFEEAQFKNIAPAKKLLIGKYFQDMGNKRYWVRKDWSDKINFQYHDIIDDKPFEYVDLILCRNLFIYFDRGLQEKILERFWMSLNKGGFLVMGIVESMMGGVREKFIEYDRDTRIFIKK